MWEYTANELQTINPGETAIFTVSSSGRCNGMIRHRDGTGNFLLKGWTPFRGCGCCCNRSNSANFLVEFGANIAVPTGQTVGQISVAITVDGATVPASTMISTPAAVEEFSNISRAINIPIWNGCCESVAVRNTSDIPILMQNANIVFSRPDLNVTY
jgi:hypothetical protein